MTIPPKRGSISQDSYVSIGLMVILLGAALWVSNTVSGIKETILPRLASMEEKIISIASDIALLRAQMSKYLTAGEVQGMIDSELRTHEKGVESRIDNMETRIRNLEGK